MLVLLISLQENLFFCQQNHELYCPCANPIGICKFCHLFQYSGWSKRSGGTAPTERIHDNGRTTRTVGAGMDRNDRELDFKA